MSLQVWFFMQQAGILANHGLHNTTITNNTTAYNTSGKCNRTCMALEASTSSNIKLDMNFASFSPKAISLAFWFYPFEYGSNYAALVAMADGTSYNNVRVGICTNKANSSLVWCVSTGSSHNECAVNTSDVPANKWTHLVTTYDGTNMKFYINGQLKSTTASTLSISYLSSLYIGRWGTANVGGIQSKIDDFRVYDHALSAKEVAELAKGLVLWYQLNGETQIMVPSGYQQLEYLESSGTQVINTNILPEDTYQYNFKYALREFRQYRGPFTAYTSETANAIRIMALNGSSTDVYIEFNAKAGGGSLQIANLTSATDQIIEGSLSKTQYTLKNLTTNTEFSRANSSDLFSTKGTALQNTMTLFGRVGYESKTRIYYFDTYNNGVCIQKLIPAKRLSDNTLGMYDIISHTLLTNVGTGTFIAGPNTSITGTIYDSSGYSNNGTIVGSLTAAAGSPRYGTATQYPDSACSIGIGNLSTKVPDGNFTFNIWFKKKTGEWSSKTWETILGGPSGFELEGKLSSTTKAYIHPYSWGGGSTSSPNSYSIAYTLDEWHMITMVRTTSTTKFYLDGEWKVDGTAGSIPSGDYFIGAWKTATQQNYRGYFSDVRIYATALTADQVAELYRTSMIVNSDGTTSPRGA